MAEQNRDQTIEDFVVWYMRKRGFRQTERQLREELAARASSSASPAAPGAPAQGAAAPGAAPGAAQGGEGAEEAECAAKFGAALESELSAAHQMMLFCLRDEYAPARYAQAYAELKAWAEKLIEPYKTEVCPVLYPTFVHTYLELLERFPNDKEEAAKFFALNKQDFAVEWGSDIAQLQNINSAEVIKECRDNIAKLFREKKFIVYMTHEAFELLTAFLHQREPRIMLGLIVQYLDIKVTANVPRPEARAASVAGQASDGPVSGGALQLGMAEEVKAFHMPPVRGAKWPADQVRPRPVPPPSEELERAMRDEAANRLELSRDEKLVAMPSVCMATLYCTHDELNACDFSRDSQQLAGAFSDSSVRLWDVADPNRKYRALRGHYGPVYGLSFSPDCKWLLSSSEDTTVRLWSIDAGAAANVVCYKGHGAPVWDVAFAPAMYYFASASHDRTARVWATNHAAPVRILVGHTADVNVVRFHPNCSYVATGSSDKCVRLWDVSQGQCVRMYSLHTRPVTALAFSPNGRTLVSGAEDGTIVVSDVATCKKLALIAPAGPQEGRRERPSLPAVSSISYSTSGDMVATASLDGTVRLWDAQELAAGGQQPIKPLRVFGTKRTSVHVAKFSPQNYVMAAGPHIPQSQPPK
eukprot:m51a1_g6302 putative transcription initiation factor tfiid subunit 5-like (642) ;mRNA; f:301240-304270